jgi:hypothetical protein
MIPHHGSQHNFVAGFFEEYCIIVLVITGCMIKGKDTDKPHEKILNSIDSLGDGFKCYILSDEDLSEKLKNASRYTFTEQFRFTFQD